MRPFNLYTAELEEEKLLFIAAKLFFFSCIKMKYIWALKMTAPFHGLLLYFCCGWSDAFISSFVLCSGKKSEDLKE